MAPRTRSGRLRVVTTRKSRVVPGRSFFFFVELYSRFNVRNGTQPSIRVKCIDKRAWLSLALCEGCNH